MRLASTPRVWDRGWLCAAAIAIACNVDPGSRSDEAAEGDGAASELPEKAACERVREDFTTGECRGVRERWLLLGCEDAPPDDPACVEQSPARQACTAKITALRHDDSGLPQTAEHTDPSQWKCEYPRPPPQPKSSYSPVERRKGPARTLPPLRGEELIQAACATQYAHLRTFPNVDRAVLEHAWRSDACRRRHEAVLLALNIHHGAWASGWAKPAWDRDGATEPWRLPEGIEPPVRDRIIAALDAWCADAPCRVLGRCTAAMLPAEHPTFPGALTCVARDDATCERSQACAAEGRCRFDATTAACVPGDDDDCARSTLCSERRLCDRIDDPPHGATCGGTLPATSGADTIGFVNNAALGRREAVVELQSESIVGPHAEVVVGLSAAQLADVSACLDLNFAIAPAYDASITFTVDIDGSKPAGVRIFGGSLVPVDDAGVFERCLERKAAAWRFRAAKGRSVLTFAARIRSGDAQPLP